MIQFQSVTHRYASHTYALRDLSFDIAQGEMVFLTGHSGAGKSTVLKLISAIEYPTQGQILMNGQPLHRLSRANALKLRRSIGIILQDPLVLNDRTVFDNVALPLMLRGCLPREITRHVHAALDTVGLLSRQKDFPIALSSGEQQRVSIARAVVCQPPLLLADEPTGNLDTTLSYTIMELFAHLNRRGTTILIASHDLALIARLKYRVLTLNAGTLGQPFDETDEGLIDLGMLDEHEEDITV